MASVPSPSTSALQAAFASALLDELARAGMRDVVVCPGSRSTPLVLAAVATPGLRVHVRLDERSAGFFALGRALADARPAAIVVTSGTAAAELTAAVVEADLARVPLVVLTADRPPELRGVGAAQTIDQVKLFGGAVRRFEDPGVVRPGSEPSWRALGARLVAAAIVGRGPVHLNLSLVEPLDAAPGDVPPGRADGAPWRATSALTPGTRAPDDALEALTGATLVVAGRGLEDADAVLEAAATQGWPVLADPLSGARRQHPNVVAAADALVGDATLRARLRPDAVVVLGAPHASRALAEALAGWAARVVAVDPRGWPDDPQGLVGDVVAATPGDFARALVATSHVGSPATYLASWRAADDAAQRVFDEQLVAELTEPAVARRLSQAIPADVPLVVASSMPVRDLEWFGAPGSLRVLSNRGANGIDGVVSTTLGVAVGARAVGLLGDLAFLHDVGSLASGLGEHGGSCVLVVLDNRGGGIFSFLPQRQSLPSGTFERLFATPPSVPIAQVAGGFGCEVLEVKDLPSVSDAVTAGLAREGVTVVVARVPDRDENVALHRRLADAARAAAREALGEA